MLILWLPKQILILYIISFTSVKSEGIISKRIPRSGYRKLYKEKDINKEKVLKMRREKRFGSAIAAIVIVMMVGVTALALGLSVTALAQPSMPSETDETETGNGVPTLPPIPTPPGMNETQPPSLTPTPSANVTATPTAAPSPSPNVTATPTATPAPTPVPGFEAVTLIAAMITVAVFLVRKRRRFRGDGK